MLFQRNLLAKLWQIVLSNLTGVYNWWQIGNGQSYFDRFGANVSPFTHLWTMAIDIQFYLLWPLIIFLLITFVKNKKTIFWILFVATILSALEMAIMYRPGMDTSRIYYGTDTRFFSLGLGACLALAWPTRRLRQRVAKSDSVILDGVGLFAFLGILLLVFAPVMNPITAFPYWGGMFIFSLLTTIFVGVIAHPGSHWNAWLTNPLFKWIGSRSYGIYLYQFPVMVFFEAKAPDMADYAMAYHVCEVILILGISELTYRLIEQPLGRISWQATQAYFMSLKKRTATKMRKIKAVSAGAVVLIGTIAIVTSVFVKSPDVNHSQLALRIRKNSQQQQADNAKLMGKMGQDKKINTSKAVKEAEKRAKKHPVNKKYEKYGISQVELQLAQKIKVTAIGDSVMAGSSNDLKQLMPQTIVNAAVSRQLNDVFPIIDHYKAQGGLANNVLIGLGTNGPIPKQELTQVMHKLGSKRHVFWINTYVPSREWQNSVNNLLQSSTKRYHNLTVIDWHDYVKKHPQWLYDDQTHPNPVGSKYYSAFITKEIVKHSQY
jgi:peptidoglycan/LPS O-acetylase OafA/YrhL